MNPRVKKILSYLLRFLVLGAILYWFFGRNAETLRETIAQLTIPSVIVLTLLGLLYYIVDGWSYARCFRDICSFSLLEGTEMAFLGFFATVLTSGAGSIPIKAYYLHRRNVEISTSAAFFYSNYILHKIGAAVTALVLLVIGLVSGKFPVDGLVPYLVYSIAFCVIVNGSLAAAAFIPAFNRLLHRLCGILPKKLEKQKAKINEQLDLLSGEVRTILADRRKTIDVTLIHALKFFTLGIVCAYSTYLLFPEIPVWTPLISMSLVMLLGGALPNVSGMGGIEFAFRLLFLRFLSEQGMTAVLLNYRLANYLIPFIISIPVVLKNYAQMRSYRTKQQA